MSNPGPVVFLGAQLCSFEEQIGYPGEIGETHSQLSPLQALPSRKETDADIFRIRHLAPDANASCAQTGRWSDVVISSSTPASRNSRFLVQIQSNFFLTTQTRLKLIPS